MYKVKIFEEDNNGPESLQTRMNSFFEENENIKILSTKMCVETVTGIDYKSILIIYEEGNEC